MTLTPELQKRITSAIILASVAVIFTVLSPVTFIMLGLACWYILISEYDALTQGRSRWYDLFGALYFTGALISLCYIRIIDMKILVALIVIVCAGDIAAYFVGKKYGRNKIAPAISPGKTWEGLGGAVIISAIVAAILGHVAPLPHALLGACFAVLGLGGDLFESALKRHAGVKDSGTIIPGHGGLFDRLDSLLPCAIFAAVALYMRTNS